jgi:trimeric autotransporter adhesin
VEGEKCKADSLSTGGARFRNQDSQIMRYNAVVMDDSTRASTRFGRASRILGFALILVVAMLGCTQKTTSNVSSIQIVPGDSLLTIGGSRTYSAVALDATGTALNIKSFTWASSDPSVASINNGSVTANKLGSSQITASSNGVTSAAIKITVLEAASTLSASGAADLMPVLLLGRRLLAGIGLNPAQFAFPRPPLASDLETAPYGSSVNGSEDSNDADGDGIPNNALSTYSGSYKRGKQPALTYSGTVRTQDTSSVSGNADVSTEVSNLKLEGTLISGNANAQPYSYTFNAQQTLKNNGTRNNSMTLKTNATLNLIAFGRTSTLEFATSAQFVPDDAGNPLAGGTFDWQDTINFNAAGLARILSERGEGVHLGSCGQYDAGRIVILDASSILNTLEFGPACGEVQFSRDGSKLEPTLGGINLEPSLPLTLGAKTNLPVSIMDLAGHNVANPATWTSSNAAVVSVDQGNLNALAIGTGTISASYGGKSASSNITVNTPKLSSITVSPATASITYSKTQQFIATATTTGGETFVLQTGSVTWASSQFTVATIGANGLATAQAINGSTIITARAFDVTSSPAVLTVTAPAVASITISPATSSILVGGTQAFTATARDVNGIAIPNQAFTWASSAPTIASIGPTGIATGVAVGTTSITAKSGLISSSPATLSVTDFTLATLPATISLIRPSATNISSSFTATITPINGFAGTVAYSLEGQPVGVTLSIIAAGNPSTLSLNVPVAVASSITPYPFKLVATSGTVSRKADMTLTITGP